MFSSLASHLVHRYAMERNAATLEPESGKSHAEVGIASWVRQMEVVYLGHDS